MGHKRTKTEEIIDRLYSAFSNKIENAELDLIVLCGDVFDGLLTLPQEEVRTIDMWISDFLRMCAFNNITLIVLEGTPSHDRGQSKRFLTIAKVINVGVDIRYVDEITVLYLEKLGINVLCIPDEANDTTDKTYQQALEIIKGKGITMVDYAFMHGQFEYQLPPHIKEQKHDSQSYLDIVKEYIFIGHIHTHSRYKRIIAQGSFDRLAHGEEEPKGHVRLYVNGKDKQVKFIENKSAQIYKTIDCFDLDLEETIAKIDSVVENLPIGSNIRVSGNASNAIFTNMNMLITRHPLFGWSKLAQDLETETLNSVRDDEPEYIPITITNKNIKELLISRINSRSPNADILKMCNEILDEVI